MQRVIEEMAKAKSDVERRYREKLPQIIRECMAFAYLGKSFRFDANSELDNRVNKRLIELGDEILADIETRAKKAIKYAEEEDDEDAILAYMKREQDGEDLITRIDKHNSNFRYFLEGWVAIGIVNGLSQTDLLSNIFRFMHNVYVSGLWNDAFMQGYLSDAIRTRGYRFGKGILRNPIDALSEIEKHSINEAFQYGRFLKYQKDGAIGYTIHRNSSFDCPYCDSFTGIVHPMDVCLLPLHPRCVCFSKPVYPAERIDPSYLPTASNRAKAILPATIKAEKPKQWDTRKVGNGSVKIHAEVNREDSDFNDILSIAEYFAAEGHNVIIPPKKTKNHSFDYDEIYGSLKGTPFYGKCPDLNIDGVWYEYEGFTSSNPKNAFRNMMKNGLDQSSRLIINDPGLSDAYIKRSIWKRINQDGQKIDEVWIKRAEKLECIYKKLEE